MKTKSRPAPPEAPQSLTLTANAQFDLQAAGEAAASLPRSRLVAYTGGPMRVAEADPNRKKQRNEQAQGDEDEGGMQLRKKRPTHQQKQIKAKAQKMNE